MRRGQEQAVVAYNTTLYTRNYSLPDSATEYSHRQSSDHSIDAARRLRRQLSIDMCIRRPANELHVAAASDRRDSRVRITG